MMLSGFSTLSAQQRGNASYYSHRLHGSRMSDGSKYHRDSMVCAHNTYPMGTMLRVRNLENGREVVVRVADRGPHRRGFKIDLSYAAARELDFIGKGFTMVEITPCDDVDVPFLPSDSHPQTVIEGMELGRAYATDHFVPAWKQRMEKHHEAQTPLTPVTMAGEDNAKTVRSADGTRNISRVQQKRGER
jgi:rare lipoprotein A